MVWLGSNLSAFFIWLVLFGNQVTSFGPGINTSPNQIEPCAPLCQSALWLGHPIPIPIPCFWPRLAWELKGLRVIEGTCSDEKLFGQFKEGQRVSQACPGKYTRSDFENCPWPAMSKAKVPHMLATQQVFDLIWELARYMGVTHKIDVRYVVLGGWCGEVWWCHKTTWQGGPMYSEGVTSVGGKTWQLWS